MTNRKLVTAADIGIDRGDQIKIALQTMIANTMSMIEFLMKISGKDTVDTVRESLLMIASGNDLIIAGEMVKELAERSGISETILRSELRKMKKAQAGHVTSISF